MRVVKNVASEFGSFSIQETEERSISSKFIDFETGLLIVEETLLSDKEKQAKMLYVTTINAKTGEIIPVDERALYIDYSEKEEIDVELQVKVLSKRETNPETGNEFYNYKFYDLKTGKEKSAGWSIAFSSIKEKSKLDGYKERDAWKKHSDDFLEFEYPKKAFEDKCKYWLGALHQQMRWQGESGYDKYSMYTVEWYKKMKNSDADFDKILKYLFHKHFGPYGWDIKEMAKRIGNEKLSRLNWWDKYFGTNGNNR